MRSNPLLRGQAIASLDHGVAVPIAPCHRHFTGDMNYGGLWGVGIFGEWTKLVALHVILTKKANQHRRIIYYWQSLIDWYYVPFVLVVLVG